MADQSTPEPNDNALEDVPSLGLPKPQTTRGATKVAARRATRCSRANASLTAQVPKPRSVNTQEDNTETRETRAKTKYARHVQNRVGKRYRDRLGAEFENLQAALCGCGVKSNAKTALVRG
jgi:hypothetical protein